MFEGSVGMLDCSRILFSALVGTWELHLSFIV